jgi:hypothetical protein
VQIGLPPPVIVGITLGPSQPAGGSNPQVLLNVQVTGLDPTVLANLGRLAVTLDGAIVPIAQVVPQGGSAYVIQVQLTQPASGSLAVWVDGSSWQPVPISVVGPQGPIQWASERGLPESFES